MESAAKLITAFGVLLGAVAWPATILAIGLIFKVEIRSAIARLPSLMDRVRKMKIAGVETELSQIANDSQDRSGKITARQVEAATRIAIEANDYTFELLNQLDRLCLEFDSTRRTMSPSLDRTQAMTRVLVQMRALAPSLCGHINAYKGSASPGSRLAAVAMMQMNPNAADINWLSERFDKDPPFIFYHAALAMQNLANNPISNEVWDQLLAAAQRSLHTVESFKGVPDEPTLEVLRTLVRDILQ